MNDIVFKESNLAWAAELKDGQTTAVPETQPVTPVCFVLTANVFTPPISRGYKLISTN